MEKFPDGKISKWKNFQMEKFPEGTISRVKNFKSEKFPEWKISRMENLRSNISKIAHFQFFFIFKLSEIETL